MCLNNCWSGALEGVIKPILNTSKLALCNRNTKIDVFPFFSGRTIARQRLQRPDELCHTPLLESRQEAASEQGEGRGTGTGCGQGMATGQGWSENGLREPPAPRLARWPPGDIPVALEGPGGS